MSESKALISSLKRALKTRGVTYKTIAQALSISESSVKRTFAEESFSLRRLEEICKLVNMSIYDLTRIDDSEKTTLSNTLSQTQESALANDELLFMGFHLVLNGWELDDIVNTYQWKKPKVIKILTTLDSLKLIELLPNNHYRLLVANVIHWPAKGPVRKKYEKQIRQEFLGSTGNDHFNQTPASLTFESMELSKTSATLINRRLQHLNKEIVDLAVLDANLPTDQKDNWGLLFAMRPWVFSLIEDKLG